MSTNTSQGLASFFVTKRRGRGPKAETFVTLKNNAPEWLEGAVRDAHCGDLPDDWTYAECRDVCEAIDSGDLDTDDVHEYADSAAEAYTQCLYQWGAEHRLGGLFSEAKSRVEDMGGYGDMDTADRIALVQSCAVEIIAETIVSAAKKARVL